MTTLAAGCCSAVTPCSWQRTNPSTICDTCRAASPSVSAWLAEQEKLARQSAEKYAAGSANEQWDLSQAVAYGNAHAYAAARRDRTVVPTPTTSVTDADLTHLAGLAISSKDTTLARIAAALLLAR